ncbi:hypothetical protein SPRG_20646 [Saprolegnia parasitica CBS 223.65]|uniref:Transposase MuDR plant domain-containing protein n=1 Tax=Saprolegnia parasitica (strain CBS 223.65) TaxID=695850 RepID=A0A067C411_SAPPC|nr:hypothetical protein SPRG_20646 [Saprolegnia parasitica CBS 223.65]KDO25524.1 hypothetical protein SPRG_20646 [Saprolegnia parasitica CBS 223.65]|eukprot:XP_012203755.1 hypothetical protein SPRG_20646 [Saprolegnia parasitica CBS 223.65]
MEIDRILCSSKKRRFGDDDEHDDDENDELDRIVQDDVAHDLQTLMDIAADLGFVVSDATFESWAECTERVRLLGLRSHFQLYFAKGNSRHRSWKCKSDPTCPFEVRACQQRNGEVKVTMANLIHNHTLSRHEVQHPNTPKSARQQRNRTLTVEMAVNVVVEHVQYEPSLVTCSIVKEAIAEAFGMQCKKSFASTVKQRALAYLGATPRSSIVQDNDSDSASLFDEKAGNQT